MGSYWHTMFAVFWCPPCVGIILVRAKAYEKWREGRKGHEGQNAHEYICQSDTLMF